MQQESIRKQNGTLFFEGGSPVKSERIIYTPSAFARTSLFHLQEVGTLQALSPHTSSRSGLYSYLFFVVQSGCGSLRYEGQEYKLQEGDAVFIDCRKSYAHSTGATQLWSLQWCHFFGPSAQAVYDKYTERGGQVVFHPENPKQFTDLLTGLYELASAEDYIRDMRISTQISFLLEEIMSCSWHPENATVTRRKVSLDKIKHYIDQHYLEKLSLADVADTHFVNKQYLAQSFRDAYGMTINHYILSKKITEAKKLLRFTDLSCEEIGVKVGLGGGNYFSRRFLSVEGISPREYRKHWQH